MQKRIAQHTISRQFPRPSPYHLDFLQYTMKVAPPGVLLPFKWGLLPHSNHKAVMTLWTLWPQLTSTVPFWQTPLFSKESWLPLKRSLLALWNQQHWNHPDLHPGNVLMFIERTPKQNSFNAVFIDSQKFICVDWLEHTERK